MFTNLMKIVCADPFLVLFFPGRLHGYSKPQAAQAGDRQVLSWRLHYTGDDSKHQLTIIIVTMLQSLCPTDKSSNRDYNYFQPLS